MKSWERCIRCPNRRMLSTNRCIMSSSSVEYWVLISGCYVNHHKIVAQPEMTHVQSLVEKTLLVKSSIIKSTYKDIVVDAGNVNVYYQEPDTESKTTVETLAGHWQKLSELIKPGQQAAFFRMEIVDPISPGT